MELQKEIELLIEDLKRLDAEMTRTTEVVVADV